MVSPLYVFATTVAQSNASSSLFDFRNALLAVLTAALFIVTKRLFSLHQRLEALENVTVKVEVAATQPPQSAIPPQTIAAIGAAIHATLRARYRILSVGQPCPHRQAWSVEGRRQVFHSHNVR